ncbi:MAG: permease [Mycobacteriales bacterium]
MSATSQRPRRAEPSVPPEQGRVAGRPPWPEWVPGAGLVAAAVLLLRPDLKPLWDTGAAKTWLTVFVSVVVQAIPFLTLGVVVSAALAVLVPADLLARLVPRRAGVAVPLAGAAGALLLGCECGSVPIAGRLLARGVPAGVALAFLLSAPAINPVVLVATAVAFPGQPEMVVARLLASLAVSVLTGLLWTRLGRLPGWLPRVAARRAAAGDGPRWAALATAAREDFIQAGGFLVVGSLTSATLNVTLPRGFLTGLGGQGVLSVAVLGLFAVLLAICSEADAFIAASFTAFSPTARLAFMVVGPAIDVKLFALQVGVFGRSFAVRFAPVVLAVALLASLGVGAVLL